MNFKFIHAYVCSDVRNDDAIDIVIHDVFHMYDSSHINNTPFKLLFFEKIYYINLQLNKVVKDK
jgi:hypothetical protein